VFARALGPGFYSGLVATEDPCVSGLAREGFASGDDYFVGVHIRCCGNGQIRLRPYGGSLSKSAKVTKALCPFRSVPRCGSAYPRSGPAPWARRHRPSMAGGWLARHPCRVAHCAEPALGLSRGRAPQKPNRGGLPAGLIVRLYTAPCRSLAGDDATPANPAAPETPPSLASQLPQKSKGKSTYTHAPHHSSGRALARLQLLILIHPPPREAEWRCSSGDGRAAPFDAVELIACRCQRSQPEGDAPG
jgi:hypothetical protein